MLAFTLILGPSQFAVAEAAMSCREGCNLIWLECWCDHIGPDGKKRKLKQDILEQIEKLIDENAKDPEELENNKKE